MADVVNGMTGAGISVAWNHGNPEEKSRSVETHAAPEGGSNVKARLIEIREQLAVLDEAVTAVYVRTQFAHRIDQKLEMDVPGRIVAQGDTKSELTSTLESLADDLGRQANRLHHLRLLLDL